MASINYTQGKKIGTVFKYVILILVGFVMIYPLIWMVGATFKTNNEIFSSMSPFTLNPTLDGYKNAMNDYGGKINLFKAMLNTYSYVIPKVIFTVISCTITAYGFGRFNFVGKNVLFALLMSTLFLPNVVMNVPQFIMYNNFGWVDSDLYLPLIIIFIILAAVGGVILADMYFWAHSDLPFATFMNAVSIGIAVLFCATLLFVFPVHAVFENTVKATIRTAFLMFLKH